MHYDMTLYKRYEIISMMQELLALLRQIEDTEKLLEQLEKDVVSHANELFASRLRLIALQQEYLHIIEDMRSNQL